MKVIHNNEGACHTYCVTDNRDVPRWGFVLFLLWNCVPVSAMAVVNDTHILLSPHGYTKVKL